MDSPKCVNCNAEATRYGPENEPLCKECLIDIQFKRPAQLKATGRHKIATCDEGALRLKTIVSIRNTICDKLFQHLNDCVSYRISRIGNNPVWKCTLVKQLEFENFMAVMHLPRAELDKKFIELSEVAHQFHSKGFYIGVFAPETICLIDGKVKLLDYSYLTDGTNELGADMQQLESIPDYTLTAAVANLSLNPFNKQTDLESLLYFYMLAIGSAKMRSMINMDLKEMVKIKKTIKKKFDIPEGNFHIHKVFLENIRSVSMDSL